MMLLYYMSNNFYITTEKSEQYEKPTWAMVIGVEDTYLMGNVKREVTLVLRVDAELNAWPGTMWHRQGYKTWLWFDKEDMDSFVTYFTLKYSSDIKTIWD